MNIFGVIGKDSVKTFVEAYNSAEDKTGFLDSVLELHDELCDAIVEGDKDDLEELLDDSNKHVDWVINLPDEGTRASTAQGQEVMINYDGFGFTPLIQATRTG